MESLSTQALEKPIKSDTTHQGDVPNMKPNQTSEEKDLGVGTTSENASEAESLAANGDDYPQGATLAFIVMALAISMFLVALDMVRRAFLSWTFETSDLCLS